VEIVTTATTTTVTTTRETIIAEMIVGVRIISVKWALVIIDMTTMDNEDETIGMDRTTIAG
jgi:hypothetical protein